MNLNNASLTQLAELLKTKQISSVELTQHFLNRIKDNSSLNAFITVAEETALLDAQKADKNLSNQQSFSINRYSNCS